MDTLPFDLNNLHFFVLVVERRGFTAAADALGVPKSRVSRHVAELEESLGTRLLQRNSRKLELTEAGSIQSRICTIRWGLFASPAYLSTRPVQAIEDLADADALM